MLLSLILHDWLTRERHTRTGVTLMTKFGCALWAIDVFICRLCINPLEDTTEAILCLDWSKNSFTILLLIFLNGSHFNIVSKLISILVQKEFGILSRQLA